MAFFINAAGPYAVILLRALNQSPRPGLTGTLTNRGYTSIVTSLVLSRMECILTFKRIRYLSGRGLIPKTLLSMKKFHVREIGNS
jgi:hypothetical protein